MKKLYDVSSRYEGPEAQDLGRVLGRIRGQMEAIEKDIAQGLTDKADLNNLVADVQRKISMAVMDFNRR